MKNVHDWVNATRKVHTLRHLETGEFICLRQDTKEYVACFSDGDTARQFREELGLIEFVDVATMRIGDAPFDNFWLDGDMIGRALLTDHAHRV
jgi:hypothetical protein